MARVMRASLASVFWCTWCSDSLNCSTPYISTFASCTSSTFASVRGIAGEEDTPQTHMHRHTHVLKLGNMVRGSIGRRIRCGCEIGTRSLVVCAFRWLMVPLTSPYTLHGECGVERRTNHADRICLPPVSVCVHDLDSVQAKVMLCIA